MVAVMALGTLILTGCNSVSPYFDPAKPHHTAQGFQNNDSAKVTKTRMTLHAGSLSARGTACPSRPKRSPPPPHPT